MITKYKSIIVDDEPHARFRLKQILEQSGKFELIAEARDGLEGATLINQLHPEVVFLDIQMPGMNGFEMLERITTDPYVIFCTAFDQYALQAFETQSIDYLLKPIELPRLIKTIEKLRRLSEQSSAILKLQSDILNNSSGSKSTIIPVKIGDRILLISLNKIVYFEASEKSVYFYDQNRKQYLSDNSLQCLETKLPEEFIRVSRSVIVNKNFIAEFRRYFKGKYILILNDSEKTKIITGSSYSERINKLLEY
ncbi:MAG TPA: LytTR family DNA-binding domain-containing protein [Prolixibacteraceae bacterium]|nr:LytTR family DNA-binding domain-containing protein [Prolixibacteraceae bacterium]